MTRIAIVLAALWVLIIFPGMILGYLWSGDVPVWPPVVSGTTRDFVDWLLLFALGYGVPVAAIILFLIGRRRRRPN